MSILLDNTTRVIVQGITGREGQYHTRNMKAAGTNMVGGVTPGKGGETVEGLPVFDTVAEAKAATGANASCIFVPPSGAADAIMEAASEGIALVVCITEGIPVIDMTRAMLVVHEHKARLIGPNCFGLYNCNLGLNASMGVGLPPKGGNISLVTQSGAYGMAIFGLAQQRHLRFAKILSHGNKADVTDHEILDYLANDDETSVLCLFLESVSNGRAFYDALTRIASANLS